VNRNATAGSPEDIYKHNPWRAPGTAPVANACGLAGGTPWAQEGVEAGDYTKTKYAHHGMSGTELQPLDTGVVWTIGLEEPGPDASTPSPSPPNAGRGHVAGRQ
jgi:hypothetical protein